ncbi:MAG: PilT/PilU family type 4a pilus ATPase [Myxococcales bacterium]|nr:PilT/PilU family type 4a pilus ATPase [Myxococcales bacterium]MCB9519705.1 PilT/PilU family type 4a pilus ATPase [Myxococcales bacterium]MCB9530396.1 PilT/PilU family type 4a pilus ATPase [Myxococcales bacterium]MCB9533643.1 PilT/PilU family type 4a pilus ATPase [Myxococcales bacterium]
MARLDSFLQLVTEQGASDLHFCAGAVPTIRHDGQLVQLPFRKLTEQETKRFLLEILTDGQRERFNSKQDLDFVYSLDGVGRFRANYFRQARGVGAVFRIIPNSIPTLDQLAMPSAIRQLCDWKNGLVLVSGPTGAGKTTTLAAMVHEIATKTSRHIITIEDPIEFIHPTARSVITQRQVGVHVDTFAGALRSALRESPDVVVVGEMRDLETMSLALSAAETGVLVFGTLHTNSAASGINRIVDAAEEESREQVRSILSVLLRGIVAQHLVRRSTGEGRIAAVEVLVQNFAVSNLIRENKIHQIDGLLQSTESAGTGMMSLDNCLLRYLKKGEILLEDALAIATDPEYVREAASKMPEDW